MTGISWLLYSDEYGRIKFGNLPLLAQFNWLLTVIEWTLILMRCLHFNNVNRFGIPKQLFLVSSCRYFYVLCFCLISLTYDPGWVF